ncbi:MAG: DUF4959 domain-containing protein [Chitinophagaceae bacterium]
MKNILFIAFALFLFSCKKSEVAISAPSEVSAVQVQPRVGGALVQWKLPTDSNFLYLEVRYQKKGETVITKVSKYTDSVLIDGLLNKLEYNFEVQAFNATKSGVKGGNIAKVGPVRPIRRGIATAYFPADLTKLPVTDAMIDTYTQESSEGPKKNLVDGDRLTYWHSAWSAGVAPLPHWIKVNNATETKLGAIKYYFRNNTSLSGRPTQFALETSTDGLAYTRVYTSKAGLSVAAPPTQENVLAFDKNYSSKYFRVMVLDAGGAGVTYVTLGDMSFYSMREELTDMELAAEANY